MVESIKELKKICSKEKEETGLTSFYRKISFYFTKTLLYTSISANQTSILAMVVGLTASLFFVFSNPWYSLVGAFFLHLWLIGDWCDGNIARYRGTVGGNIGGSLDWLNIQVVPYVLFICLSIGAYNQFHDPRAFIFGFSATFFWFATWTLSGVKKEIHSILQINKQPKFKKISSVFPSKFSVFIVKFILILNKILYNILGESKFIAFRKCIPEKNASDHLWMFNYQKSTENKKAEHMIQVVYLNIRKLSAPILIPIYVTAASLADIILYVFSFQSKIWILNINFIYILLVYFGILYPLLWISQIFNYRNQKDGLKNINRK